MFKLEYNNDTKDSRFSAIPLMKIVYLNSEIIGFGSGNLNKYILAIPLVVRNKLELEFKIKNLIESKVINIADVSIIRCNGSEPILYHLSSSDVLKIQLRPFMPYSTLLVSQDDDTLPKSTLFIPLLTSKEQEYLNESLPEITPIDLYSQICNENLPFENDNLFKYRSKCERSSIFNCVIYNMY